MKSIRVLSFFLSVVLLLPFASCAAPEEDVALASPVVEAIATPTATPRTLMHSPTPPPIPAATPSPTPGPTPTPWPSFAWNPEEPYGALRAYMDAEIAAAPEVGAAPFEAGMFNYIMYSLWYYGRFSLFSSMAGRTVEYLAYAIPPDPTSFRMIMLTDNEDIGFGAVIKGESGLYMDRYGVTEGEGIVPRLQEETKYMELVYRNTVTIPEEGRERERAVNRPEMRDTVIEAAVAYYIELHQVEKGRYTVVVGDYEDHIATYAGSEGCLEAKLTMYIRGKTSKEKEWENFDHVYFDQALPGDTVEGEFSTSWAYPNAGMVDHAFPSIRYPRTEEEWAWYEEEVTRRLEEYADYQWQRLLDQGVYAKEITVE